MGFAYERYSSGIHYSTLEIDVMVKAQVCTPTMCERIGMKKLVIAGEAGQMSNGDGNRAERTLTTLRYLHVVRVVGY